MGRLIAFDQLTASALVANTRTAAQLGHGSPLKAALANEGDATLLMPSPQTNEFLVVNVRRPQVAVPVSLPSAPVRPVTKATTAVESSKRQPPKVESPLPELAATTQTARTAPPATASQSSSAPQPLAMPKSTAMPLPAPQPQPTEHQRAAKSVADSAPEQPVTYEASGFLGLDDYPLYAEDLAPKPKKKWWQRILD